MSTICPHPRTTSSWPFTRTTRPSQPRPASRRCSSVTFESYLNDLQRWLSEWRIASNVPKSTTIIFARARRRFVQPRPVTLFGEPIQWVDTICYVGVTLDTRLIWSPHIDQVRKRTALMMGMLDPLLNRKSDLSVRNGVLLFKQLIRPMIDHACSAWRSAVRTHVRRLQCCNPSVFALLGCPLVR